MKRILFVFLMMAALLVCTGCQVSPNAPQNSVTVYYKAASISYGSQDGVIAPYHLDATDHENDHSYLLNAYLSQQVHGSFASTFPAGTCLVSLDLNGLTAKVVLSDQFAGLKGLDLTIACICLTRTIITLTDCHEVIISAETAQLDGHNFITLNRDSYLLIDESGAD